MNILITSADRLIRTQASEALFNAGDDIRAFGIYISSIHESAWRWQSSLAKTN
jgi:hypothetical protein